MKQMLDCLYPVRDKVLSHIQLASGETLLDVGCGDGLIAFGALEKISDVLCHLSVISDDLLHHAKVGQEMNVQTAAASCVLQPTTSPCSTMDRSTRSQLALS